MPKKPREPAGPVRCSVLGPVRCRRGGVQLAVGSPQQRALLAALLLRRGRTATASQLIDDLWGGEPPHAALAAVRTRASRLRRILSAADAEGPGGGVEVVGESGGYALRGAPGALDLDLDRAERRAAEAEEARRAGDLPRARRLLDEALSLWSGESLAGIPGPYAEAQRARLEEWRLGLLETRLDLDVRTGRHAAAVPELTLLTAAHPLRERPRELLMLALHRSGRQAEALAVYSDARRLLADELGIGPGPGLTGLHRRMLAADPSLAEPDAPDADAAERVRPAQLPPGSPNFTGRESLVADLGACLAAAADRDTVTVGAVAGIGGVGKTTLAVHVARAAAGHFPDGQLHADLQGAGPGPAARPEAVLGAFLRALGMADAAIPAGTDERAALYRSLLARRRVLVLLDDARDAAQVRPLLPGAAGCAAVVTSRNRLVGLESVHLVDLDVMTPDEALALFTRIVGERRVAAERAAARDVVAACGFLPLALRIAAARLAARPAWSVATMARRLADERRRLDELHAGDLAVTATFDLGYAHLAPDQARAFRLLGLPDGPDISATAASALLDLPLPAAEPLLESLVDISLLESPAPGRYRFHDLIRLHARARAERDEPAGERESALGRLLDFYLGSAAGAYGVERPGDRLVEHLTPVPGPGLAFADGAEARDWLFGEAACVLALARGAAGRRGMLRRAADLLVAAKDVSEAGAAHQLYREVAGEVLEAARKEGDHRAEGRARTVLATNLGQSGRLDEAAEHARVAVRLGDLAADPLVRCHATNVAGIVATYQGRYQEAARWHLLALEAFRAVGDRPGEASVLNNLSSVQQELGNADEALRLAERALSIHRNASTSSWRQANSLYSRGRALAGAGRFDEAVRDFTAALGIFRERRQLRWTGWTEWRLAAAHLSGGRPLEAVRHAERALAVLRGLGGDTYLGATLAVLGRGLYELGHPGRARVCWEEALASPGRLSGVELAGIRGLLGRR
ncbi:regulator [Streptomyces caatingaensis]|uniref:Regulator n=1 Tax=Streptomyces caatingaensis TaxID=1678637 RepID=A0A0K9XAC3_9ACTN|nr:BTAD domain-containing putative transcriptional regulator [Streptomyces caatingaensis]KNB50359.1 regulator [Streptomyces caatingaensis]